MREDRATIKEFNVTLLAALLKKDYHSQLLTSDLDLYVLDPFSLSPYHATTHADYTDCIIAKRISLPSSISAVEVCGRWGPTRM